MTEREDELAATLVRLTEAFNRGDYEQATEVAHPDIEFVRNWESTPLRGAEALKQWMKPDAFEEQHTELLGLTAAGDKVLIHQHFRAKGAGSGIGLDVESWAVWTFDADGLVTRLELFLHHEADQARAAAGLPPDLP
jgi:ketosteroid isomerase-like protein